MNQIEGASDSRIIPDHIQSRQMFLALQQCRTDRLMGRVKNVVVIFRCHVRPSFRGNMRRSTFPVIESLHNLVEASLGYTDTVP